MSKREILLLFISIFLLIKINFAQEKIYSCSKVFEFISKINSTHIQPPLFDNDFSLNVYTNLIKSLDPNSILFLKEDEISMSTFKFEIDDAIINKNCEFYNVFLKIYIKRIREVDSLIHNMLLKTLNFEKNETYNYYPDSLIFTLNNNERMLNLERWIKLVYFKKAFSDIDSIESVNESVLNKQLPNYKKAVEERAKQLYSPTNNLDSIFSNCFLNTIARAYDPHCEYFDKTSYNNFKTELSKEVYIFGFSLDENKSGEVYIKQLVPGAPAWRSNKIHRGDILLKIKWNKNIFDVTKNNVVKTHQVINNINVNKIELTLKDQAGKTFTVFLVREKVENTNNAVKSFILAGTKKIGYISLPDFYTEWGKENALGCANDVAKEIVKLKTENIEGLILDLRNNGGGSVYEAINLAGIFINEGPLSVANVKESNKPQVLKDINRGTIYDGPLILMINRGSASASEFVAAALQDYNRALIVGSNSYGKGTMQTVFPIDSTDIKKQAKIIRTDYFKVTTGILYRISGESVQRLGVTPDISIPDMYQKLPTTELFNKNALVPKALNKKIIYTSYAKPAIDSVKQKSINRITNDTMFQKMIHYQDTLLLFYNNNEINLSLPLYLNYRLKTKHMWERIKETTDRCITAYSVDNTKNDEEWINIETTREEGNTILKNDILKDIYIQETFMIMNDLLTIKN